MSAFATAIAAGLASVADVAGEVVSYWRGVDSIELKGVPGSTAHETNDANDFPVAFTTSDWIFKASELVIGGQQITPRRGDLVKKTVAGVTRTYEVLSDGSQVYRYSDRARTRIRVHTKEKSS